MVTRDKGDWVKLGVWIVGIELVGILGSMFTVSNIESWYVSLEKPVFNPPNWVFGPVWTILYAMLGWVGYSLWKKKGNKKMKWLFAGQLALNAMWSPVFFGARETMLALIIIVSLWIVLVRLMKLAYARKREIFWWLVPYFGWVSFATVLNAAIVGLN